MLAWVLVIGYKGVSEGVSYRITRVLAWVLVMGYKVISECITLPTLTIPLLTVYYAICYTTTNSNRRH